MERRYPHVHTTPAPVQWSVVGHCRSSVWSVRVVGALMAGVVRSGSTGGNTISAGTGQEAGGVDKSPPGTSNPWTPGRSPC